MIRFEKLPDDIQQRFPRLAQALEEDRRIIFAYLFGGFAGDKPTPLSDIDIAVYLAGAERFSEDKLDLFDKLSDLLGTSEIDLVILNRAPLSLAGRILHKRLVLVDKEPFRRHRYESEDAEDCGENEPFSNG